MDWEDEANLQAYCSSSSLVLYTTFTPCSIKNRNALKISLGTVKKNLKSTQNWPWNSKRVFLKEIYHESNQVTHRNGLEDTRDMGLGRPPLHEE